MNTGFLISGCRVPVVLYHMVSDQTPSHTKHIYQHRSVKQFTEDLEYFSGHYNFISLDTMIRSLSDRSILPGRPLLLTFDDGFSEMVSIVAPILNLKGIPAAFFITVSCLNNRSLLYRNKVSILIDLLSTPDMEKERDRAIKLLNQHGIVNQELSKMILAINYSKSYLLDQLAENTGFSFDEYLGKHKPYLTEDQISEMKDRGFEFGSHSIDHPHFRELNDEERALQISESVEFLDAKNLLTHRAFAFPYNSNMVDNEFLVTLYEKYRIDITFGSNGIKPDSRFHHFQRFHMDYRHGSTRRHLITCYAKGLAKRVVGLRNG